MMGERAVWCAITLALMSAGCGQYGWSADQDARRAGSTAAAPLYVAVVRAPADHGMNLATLTDAAVDAFGRTWRGPVLRGTPPTPDAGIALTCTVLDARVLGSDRLLHAEATVSCTARVTARSAHDDQTARADASPGGAPLLDALVALKLDAATHALRLLARADGPLSRNMRSLATPTPAQGIPPATPAKKPTKPTKPTKNVEPTDVPSP